MEKSIKNPYITIIVPVYNVEKYIEQAIIDIQNQTFSDFELFLVVDCSTDKSGEICDRYSQKDIRINTIHLKENGGVSKARNEGIERAKGEYIIFLDSDDRFAPNMLEKCVSEIQKHVNKPDVLVYGLCEKHYDAKGVLTKEIPICPPYKYLKTKHEVRENIKYLEESSLYGYPWNKLYKTSTLLKSGALFPKMKFNEDIIFNIEFFYYVEQCVFLNIMPYEYIKRVNSSTTSRFIPTYYEDIMVKIDKLYKQFDEFEMLTEENKEFIAQRYVRYIFSALERNLDKRSNMNKKDRKNFLKKVIQSERYMILNKYMTGKGLSKIMAHSLKKGKIKSCLYISRIIYIVKRMFPKIFGKLN